MSRIGKQPVIIPDKVKVDIQGQSITINGPLGKLYIQIHPAISIKFDGKTIQLNRSSDYRQVRSLHGISRTLIFNMVKGVTEGYSKSLDIIGTGYRSSVDGKHIIILAGFSHPVRFPIPEGIKVQVEQTPDKQTRLTITGSDKQLVGEMASKIRQIRLPEPYKGKGIRYTGEYVRRKVGKTTA